jgi:hypothetical protein
MSFGYSHANRLLQITKKAFSLPISLRHSKTRYLELSPPPEERNSGKKETFGLVNYLGTKLTLYLIIMGKRLKKLAQSPKSRVVIRDSET